MKIMGKFGMIKKVDGITAPKFIIDVAVRSQTV